MRKRRTYTIEDVRIAVTKAICLADVKRLLNLSQHGTNNVTLRKIFDENNIDVSL